MTRKLQDNHDAVGDRIPAEPSESIGKATSQGAGAPIEPPPGEVKSKGRRRPRVKKAEKPNGPLPDVAQPAPEISKVVPFPNVAQPAPEAPKMAQQDAAKAFFEATANSQAYMAATEGLLGAVHLGLPDADVYFRTKPIEEVINPDGTKSFLNQAIVSLYKLPDGARKDPSEPRLWLMDKALVPAFRERKAKIREYQLRLAVDRQATPYLIPVPLDAHDIWGTSLRTVMQHSDTKWLKIFSNSKKGRLHEFGDDQTLEPTYPVEDFETLYMLALMPVFINTKEHDIYKRVCGA